MAAIKSRRTKEEIAALKAAEAQRKAEKAEAEHAALQARRARREQSAERIKAARALTAPKRAKDMTRAERELRRVEQLARAEIAARKQALGSAGINFDPRTAAGQREFDIRPMGGKNTARLDRYGNLFKNKSEATSARIAACQAFDDLCHVAAGDLYPPPNFEPRVDQSGTGGYVEHRAAGLESMALLKAKIGDDFHAILTARVHMAMTYTAMENAGYGDRNAMARLFVMAADAVARHFRIGGKSPMVEAANAVFALA